MVQNVPLLMIGLISSSLASVSRYNCDSNNYKFSFATLIVWSSMYYMENLYYDDVASLTTSD